MEAPLKFRFLCEAEKFLLFPVRPIYKWLMRHYAEEMLDNLPRMRWMTYDEMLEKSDCPEYFVQRLIPLLLLGAFLQCKFVSSTDDPKYGERMERAKKFLHGHWIVYDYRLMDGPPRRIRREEIDADTSGLIPIRM